MKNKNLNESHVTTCQWLGEGEGCTHTAVEGRSYCEHHLWRVYKEGSAVTRRKDTRRYNQVRLWEDLFNQAVEELEEEGFL